MSRVFAEPSYQQGVVPSSVFAAQGRTGRAVPDISAVRTMNQTLSLQTTPGYDDVTGPGSPTSLFLAMVSAG